MGADNVVEIDAEVDADDGGSPPAHWDRPPVGRHGRRACRGARTRPVPLPTSAATGAPRAGGAPAGPALRLDGRVTQEAYLGDGWRYGITVGARQYLVDAAQLRAPAKPSPSSSRAGAASVPSANARTPSPGVIRRFCHESSSPARRRWRRSHSPRTGCPRRAETVLNVVTAGDQNMVDYVNEFLAPQFEALNPASRCARPAPARATPARRRSTKSSPRSRRPASRRGTSTSPWSTRRWRGQMVEEHLLAAYRDEIATGKLVSRDTAKNALGADVAGYVLPMFHSQIALAYNPELVPSPPQDLCRAGRLGEEEPQAVRLQRHQGRHVRRGLRHRLGRGQQRSSPASWRRAPTIRRPRPRSSRRSPDSRPSTRTSR